MKLLSLLSILLVSFAFAENTQGTDGLLFDHSFDFDQLKEGIPVSYSDLMACADDFIPEEDYVLEVIELWMVYDDGNTAILDFEMRNDTGGHGPGTTTLWAAVVEDLTHVDTGYQFAGSVCWHTTATIPPDQQFRANADKCYWLAVQSYGEGHDFWLVSDQCMGNDMCYFSADDGLSWIPSIDQFGHPYDCFMVLDGTAQGALNSETWGTIKATF